MTSSSSDKNERRRVHCYLIPARERYLQIRPRSVRASRHARNVVWSSKAIGFHGGIISSQDSTVRTDSGYAVFCDLSNGLQR